MYAMDGKTDNYGQIRRCESNMPLSVTLPRGKTQLQGESFKQQDHFSADSQNTIWSLRHAAC